MSKRTSKKPLQLTTLLITLIIVALSSWFGLRPDKTKRSEQPRTSTSANRNTRTDSATSQNPKPTAQSSEASSSAAAADASDSATVVRTVDGDTLIVRIGDEEYKLRILMIDTPESVHEDPNMNVPMGKTASDFTRQYLPADKEITLEYDTEKTDQYGRLLAYVRVDGIDLGAKLVEEGLAKVVMYQPNKARHQDYLKLQKAAKKAKRGVWAYPYYEIFKK